MNKKYLLMSFVIVLFTACGGNTSSFTANNGKGSIDLKEYYPNQSISKTFTSTKRDGDNIDKSHYTKIIIVSGNTITTTVNTKVVEKVLFTDTNITTTTTENNKTEVEVMFRNFDIGNTLFSKKTESSENNALGKITTILDKVCKLQSKEEKFQKDDNIYEKDLLKIECISQGKIVYAVKQDILDVGVATDLNGTHEIYDKSYIYLKKGLGKVVMINDDCITNEKLLMIIDDRARTSTCVKKKYQYDFYIP